jgi:hypothetical protein
MSHRTNKTMKLIYFFRHQTNKLADWFGWAIRRGLAKAAVRDGWRSRLATPLFHLLSPGRRQGESRQWISGRTSGTPSPCCPGGKPVKRGFRLDRSNRIFSDSLLKDTQVHLIKLLQNPVLNAYVSWRSKLTPLDTITTDTF